MFTSTVTVIKMSKMGLSWGGGVAGGGSGGFFVFFLYFFI